MMIKEEESLKKRLISSIQTCQQEMEKLCLELQLSVFEVTQQQHCCLSVKYMSGVIL